MNTNDIENAINHIISLQEKLCYCEKAGSTGNCKISDLFEKFVFWS